MEKKVAESELRETFTGILRLTVCIEVKEADLDRFFRPLIDQWRS